jgi:hypothetical protein
MLRFAHECTDPSLAGSRANHGSSYIKIMGTDGWLDNVEVFRVLIERAMAVVEGRMRLPRRLRDRHLSSCRDRQVAYLLQRRTPAFAARWQNTRRVSRGQQRHQIGGVAKPRTKLIRAANLSGKQGLPLYPGRSFSAGVILADHVDKIDVATAKRSQRQHFDETAKMVKYWRKPTNIHSTFFVYA